MLSLGTCARIWINLWLVVLLRLAETDSCSYVSRAGPLVPSPIVDRPVGFQCQPVSGRRDRGHPEEPTAEVAHPTRSPDVELGADFRYARMVRCPLEARVSD